MKHANVEDLYRLSPIQEGMLFHTLHDGASAPYFEQFVLIYDRDLDLDRLERVWQALLDRHPILRTAFFWEEVEQPVQVVHRQVRLPFERLDWRGLSAEEREQRLRSFLEEDRARGFRLDRAPLLRIAAILWDEATIRLAWSYHHLLLDGWSANLLLREAAELYAGFARGKVPPPVPRRPFRDYIGWLSQQDLVTAEAYWRRTLDGFAPTALGIDRAPGRPTTPGDAHEEIEVALSPAVAESAGRFARQHRLTFYTVVAAAWALALARYSGARDVVFGSTVSGRPEDLPGAESMIGCFINTLPVRVRISFGQPLLPWLRELQAAQMELRRYEHSPLVEVRRWSGLPADRPLFESILVFENYAGSGQDSARGSSQGFQRTNFPLTLVAWPGREVVLQARYYTGRFAAEAVRSLLARVAMLLEALASAAADASLGDLLALSPAEREQAAAEQADTRAGYPLHRCLHELIGAQVERTPDAMAVLFDEESLTYRELDSRANRLAYHLRRLGVGPEARVGVAMERSAELVVALLGVLKAGGAYVPLDPSYPGERLAAMADDAFGGLTDPVVLTQEHLAGILPKRLQESGTRVISIDSAWDEVAREPCTAPPVQTSSGALAYVIFTSGSTGRPKGAMNTHRGIVNRLLWMQEAYGLTADDCVLQKTPFSFDVSVWEFFWPLLTGARLVLAVPGGHQDPAYLARLISERSVTTLHFVPSMLQAFLEETGIEGLGGLRRVMASGEALAQALVARFFSRMPRGVELHNLYGPTEAAVDVTAWPCERGAEGSSVPIGRPVANTQIHLLDADLLPAPAGVPGELYIGGVQVGRGYLERPDLTAERFVPDPFDGPGERLYRTGDLARRRSDGAIEYLGRIDFQVKIRGFRIELGEIEAALQGHPAVREAVVLAREDEPGDRRLVAYVVPAAAGVPPAAELAEHLRRTLPDHMVPPAFVALDALPLSPNGKVDRKALPAPGRVEPGAARIAPRDATEEAVQAVWSELLKVERIGVEDNFFSLGGDSIKAVRLVSRVNARLGSDLRVQDVFRHPSVAALAARLHSARSEKTLAEERAAGLAEIEALLRNALLADERQRARLPEGWEDVIPLTGIEKGMTYYTLLLPDQPVYHDQYAYLLSIADVDAFFRAFELLVGRHAILRSAFHLYDFAEPMKVVHSRVPIDREVVSLAGLAREEQGRRVTGYRAADLRRRFTFDGELLWRLKLFQLDGSLHCAVWTWHHAIFDGWSNYTFWIELDELAARQDLATIEALPPLASSYKDYLAITLGRSRSPATEAFWRDTLAGASRNKLPFNRARTRAKTAFGMDAVNRSLSRDALALLRARSAALGVPLQAVFLAAHVHLLHVASGEEDVVTGLVTHERPAIADSDRVIGCFLNTVPVRLRRMPGESGAALVRRVSRYLVAEKEHEIPLVDIAGIVGARQSAENPIFDTLLNFMDFHIVEDVRENVLFRPAASAVPRESFDLDRHEMTNTLFDVEVSVTGGAFAVQIKYSPRHFEAEDVERALVLYERILEALGRNAEAPLGTEMLLSESEREQLAVAYNDTARDYPREWPLHSFFEEQAARHPERTAVVAGGRALTYGELESRANRTARYLLSRGVQPGDNVGVCCERTPELMAALLGVLKAAAAYVPLEPSYPAARKGYIVRQSAVSKILADALCELPPGTPAEVVLFEPEALEGYPDTPLSLRPRPEDLAYTIYTSGSTGNPKGVMIEHHSAVNLIGWVNREFEVGPGTRVLMASSVCFDLSVYDVFGSLAAGATVVMARQEEVQEPSALQRLVVDQKVTFWNSVPSTLGLLVQFLEEAEPSFRGELLRLAFLSGDWIPLSLPARARRFFPNLRLVSLGGATEGTVWSIYHPIEGVEESWLSIPYGRPLDNNRFYVLDGSLELVPPGVVGDLYIGGVGVARGYAGEAEKTAASYVPDPFAGPGQRLYRTGDLGRMLPLSPNREIEFLGRSDHQVKVRGFRIELGEVESQLGRAPGVREAVVLARADRMGQKYLCGYVAASAEVTVASLQAHLAGSLPGYMIPDTFVFLFDLPLTANGKIDRKALPEPEVANAAPAEAHVAPATETEAALVEIWEEVLGLSGIGTAHDFFALGGHSLSAIQVLTRVRRRFEVNLPLPDFFDNPTAAGLAAAVDRLRGAGAAAPRLRRYERPERLPLSFAQERLWFLDRLQPDSAAYSIPLALGLRGALSVPVLAASLDEVAARHEALRTTFAEVDGRPVQRIATALDLAPPVVDLESLPEALRLPAARRLLGEEAARPFDLARGPLARATLVRLAEDHHLAMLNVHHIVADGWSMGVLVEEVGALYAALSRGEHPELPALPIQYADFAVWQRETLTAEAMARQIAFWRERLADAPPVLDLPFDRPRPAVQRFRGAQLPAFVPADRLAGLAEVRRRHGATLFMVLLAAFQALLARLTGREDIVVGSPVAGRHQVETESLIGFFVNTLALRGDLSRDPTFTELLARVREATLEAYAHDALPFERLVEELQPERSLSCSPVFQVVFALQNAPMGALELPELTLEPAGFEVDSTKFDLSVSLNEGPQGIGGLWEYDRELFDPTTVRRIQAGFVNLLSGALADPAYRLSGLPLLGESERHQVLVEWNDTRPAAGGLPVPQRFEAQAARTPESPALVLRGREVRYGDLNRSANLIAHRLVEMGVGPGVVVGLCADRSAEHVAGMLGVLKAGGVYLPLDPGHPDARLSWLLDDAGSEMGEAPVVLTQEPLHERLRGLAPPAARLVRLEPFAPGGIAFPLDAESNLVPRAAMTDPAYLIYTSGTTGLPKAVVVEHRNLASTVNAAQEAFGFAADDRMPCLAPFSFDISLLELLGPLLAGGASVLYELRPTLDVRELAAGLGAMTRLHAVPALMRQIVDAVREDGACQNMRSVFVGGDAVPPDLLADLPAAFPRAEIHVLYGPTEATIICCHERISGAPALRLPLGRPLPGARLEVLDRQGSPVPIGVAGEISIGGTGVSRGYLNRPQLTEERFPLVGGARTYRTGDLARHTPDGRLEFLGRIDGQVKVRGFRIELGEIEAAFARHPSVRQAVAVVRDEGERHLAAYVVPREPGDLGSPAFVAELKTFVAERLPEYMVPAFVVALAELPLSANGKVDRQALPAPGRASSAGPAEAPRTAIEELLSEIWQDVLHLPAGSFGIRDNFFALGGHSLLATQVVARVRHVTGVEIPVRALFEQPTLAGFAPRVEEALRGGATADEPLIPQPRDGHPPLSFAQERLWFLARLEPDDTAYNMPFRVRLRGALKVRALAASLAEVVRRHEALRTAFGVVGGRPVQVISPPAGLALLQIDLSGLPPAVREDEVRRRSAAEATRPFDLEAGPLFRAVLLSLDREDHRALLNIHHIVSDAWSMGVLFREVAALYPAFRAGAASPLPEPPIQYADFALWQRRRLSGERLAAQIAFWRRQLGGDPPPLELPTDRPRPPVQDHRGAGRSLPLSGELTRSLAELGRREGATLFMVLLAAFQALLGRYSGQEDVVVGTPVAGRDRGETEGLIGLFLNTLALRAHLGGNPTFRELLAQAREVALGAFAHAELPFEKLVEELRPRRDLSRHPVFDVMLNLVNTPQARAEIPGLVLAFEEPGNPGAKFAMTLYAGERGDRLELDLVYQRALFTPERAAAVLDQLAAFLEQAAADPARPIGSYTLITATARALLPDPGASLPAPRYEPVPALVETWAAATPGEAAVRQGEEEWSYAELVERAESIARFLAAAGACGETVAVTGPPSFGLIAALLGVLRAGGVMLTLDPALPPARRRLMAREAGAHRLLCVGADPGELARDLPGLAVTAVDPRTGRPDGFAAIPTAAPLPPMPEPADRAYVFFTSGSTGVPKGILGCHQGVSHFLDWQRRTFGVGPGDRCAQLTALSFDALLRDVFLPLTSGAVLCLPEEAGLPPARLVAWLERKRITLLHTLPAVAQSWIGGLERPPALPALRRVFFSGEPLTEGLVRRLRRALPAEAAIVNLYGPTETTMTKCFFVVPAEPLPGIQPLGHPLPETQALVLGPQDRLCGVSEAGEIVLRTPFRTLGYLNAPEEDRNRFVPNPFRPHGDPDSADLLYRTGDRGRYRPDGSLEILGRLDDQVKVRGVRVEPGEIEAALARHPAVAAAAVVAPIEPGGERRLVAYVGRAEGRNPSAAELREHLRQELPEPLVPAAFVVLAALPLTPTGKVDRRALPDPEALEPDRSEYAAPRTALERAIAEVWQEVLQLDRVGLQDNFFDLGGHSLRLVEVHARVSRLVATELPLVDFFRYPTVSALAGYLETRATLAGDAPVPESRARRERLRDGGRAAPRAIAIVGMAGRFPGAADVETFWRNLCDGVDCIAHFSDAESLAAGVDPATLTSPRYVKAGSVVEGIDRFDAAFFGFTPREAEILDPQHRLFLECAWEVLERAGYDPRRYPDPIGVYAGVHRSTYLVNLYSHPELVRAVGDGILKQTTDKDYLATRASYKLGLRGPSFTVQTTCSTSLVAVHLACQGILNGDCRMALAGGVSIRVPQEQGYFREEGDILSPDGRCRAFDAEGRGTIFTNGLGLVLLKGLEEALADGDTVHAVIRGTAINNDGADKVGYAAPSVDGQAEVIAAAQRAAGVEPETITYVEGHGTATVLGDPIEVAALTRAFREGGAVRRGFCALGSVKSNLGHLDTAAGVAGLIKTAFALEHGLIPPSLHFERPNPNIDFAASPFYVNTALTEWRTGGTPRRAGVSSFGIGGTNVHAVLEEPPRAEPSGPSRPYQLLLLSARTPSALEAATARLAEHLEGHPEIVLADAAFTLQVGRRVFEHRRAIVCRDREDALAALRSPERWTTAAGDAGGRPVAFLFPGQGAQHAGMGRGLYESEPIFREALDSCAELLAPHLRLDLRTVLFPPEEESETAGRRLTETRLAQPALFAVEYALARLWMEWGFRPAAMIGHSLGEIVAACLAGVFSLADALALVAARGRLMQELPPGGMLAVSLPEQELRALLAEVSPELSLAAVNAPVLCTASGPLEAIEGFTACLVERGIDHRRLHTSHAFHSAMMEPALRPFAAVVAGIELRPPRLRFLSNVTGTWIRAAEATDPAYWVRHLREPVRFSEGISTLLAEPGLALLEVGPGRALSSFARQHEAAGGRPILLSMRHPRDEAADSELLLRALARLWLAGFEPDWAGFYTREHRRRVVLPTYPFERRRHWVERRRETAPAAARPVVLLPPGSDEVWAGHLEAAGVQVVRLAEHALDPSRPEDLAALLSKLRQTADPRTAAEEAVEATPPSVKEAGPADPLERRLAAIWEELLGVRGIGSQDDFFELGGHSLLATRLVSRIRDAFRVELPIEAVFEAPVLARLAARIEGASAGGNVPPPLGRVPRTGPMPLSFAQQRLLFLEVLTPGDISYNMPLALRLRGSLDTVALHGALGGLLSRHEVLRTTYALSKGNAWQIPAPEPGTWTLPAVDLTALPAAAIEDESRRLASAEFRRPIDLFQGPVFRTALLRLGTEDHVLLITVHHIATDGWSWGILYGELVELYEARCEGRAPRLLELPLQYADYAAWQRSWLSDEALDRQIDFWRDRLAGLPLTEVPADHPRPAVRTGRGALEPFALPAEATDFLRRLGREEDSTLFMTLLSGFAVLLHHYGKGDDLVIGTDVANRRWREVEGLIGLFVNQLVLRTDLSGDPTFRELLRRVRRITLAAYAHQDAPFDKLVEVLKPARDMGRTPLFQVKLVLQNATVEPREARGLAVSLFGFHNQTAKFDLLLNLTESGAGLAGNLEYSTDLYEKATMTGLLGHYATVLRTAAERPDARVSEIVAVLAELDREVRERQAVERRVERRKAVERARRKAIAVPQS